MSRLASKDHKRFGAVVLAAGMSRRMGQPKALLDLDGRPLIARLLDTLRQCDFIGSIVVVTGHEPAAIRAAATIDASINPAFVHNSSYQAGEMLSSIELGAAAIAPVCDAFFLCLLDQPLVKPATIAAMAQSWQITRPVLLTPACQGRRGHPVMIASTCVDAIRSLPPAATLRDWTAQQSDYAKVVEVGDPGVLTDVDTPNDYHVVLRLWRTLQCRTVHSQPAA